VKSQLRTLRQDHNWSQAVLAGELKVSRQTVNSLETGRYDPSLSLAFRIARLFGQPIEAIFYPDDPSSPGGSSKQSRGVRVSAR
jgi:putative transcriptional regulator